MDLNSLNAEKARKMAETIDEELLLNVLKKIQKQATNKQRIANFFHGEFSNAIELELRKRGFDVKYNDYSNDPDPRARSYHSVTW